MKRQVFQDSQLRVEWDTNTRLYTEWASNGVQTLQRAFTPEENVEADQLNSIEQSETNERQNAQNLDGSLFDNLRTVAQGSGTFASNAVRDAAIRSCARGIVLVIRLLRKRNDAVD